MLTGAEVAIVSTAGRILGPILPKAISKIDEVMKKRKGLEDLVRTLESQLSIIQAFILDHRKIIRSPRATSQTFKEWIANLRCYAYDMEDYIEGYHAKKITGAKLHLKITALKKSLEEFNKLMEQLRNMHEGELNPPEDEGAPTFVLPDLLNNNQHLRELLGLLRGPQTLSDNNLKVTLISIVGVGGIGKTNLCKQVYKELLEHNDHLGQNQFSRHTFVSAAGKDGTKVLEDIIKSFPEQEPFIDRVIPISFPRQDIAQDGNGVNTNASMQDHHQVQQYMMHELAQRLGATRYLIVVDDVESEALAKFITSAFPENNMGGRIIMAATVVGSSTAEAEYIDDQGNESDINMEKQQHQFNIADSSSKSVLMLMMKHDRVPLALVSISEVVSGHFSADGVEQAWRQIRKAEADQWLQRKDLVLRHIYDSLDSNMDSNYRNTYMPDPQACLLYFSIFPHGYYVKRGSLIRRWLAEGRELGGTSYEDAAHNLNLINQKFIRPLHLSLNQDRHLKTCQPLGVVQDFINKMSEQESFIMLSCSSCAQSGHSNYIRRLSLHPTVMPSGDRRRPCNDDGDLPPRLRTLAVSRSTNARGIVECEQLRVLDLGAYPGLEPSELKDICEKLKLLKYLSLKPDNITEVPDSVSNLQWLETLDLGTDKVVLVPIHVVKLPYLKHLLGKFEFKDSLSAFINKHLKVSEDIKNSKLERLAGFVTRKGQGFPSLMCHMKKLWKVKIWFCRDAHAKSLTTYLPQAITKFLQDDNIDRSLSLDFNDCASPEELLDSIATVTGRLYSLKLSGKNLIKIHLFVTNLTGVTKLCLSWKTIKLDANFLGELSKLKQLKHLKLDAETIEGAYDSNPQAGNIQDKVVIETWHIENLVRLCLVFKQPLPDIEIKHRALEQLVSLHLISEDIYYCPSASMICKANVQAGAPLINLREVALNATVHEHSRNHWHEAARNHPKRPRILFIEHPRRAG